MTKLLVTSVIGLSMLTLTACGTLTGAGVGAAGGAAVGYGTGYAAPALGQGRPVCDQQAKTKTPESVEGEVTKVDVAQGRVTMRQSDGTVHEFQASTETLKDLKVGGRVEAKLREAPNC